MRKSRNLIILFLLLLSLLWASSTHNFKRVRANLNINFKSDKNKNASLPQKIILKLKDAKSFTEKNGFNDSIAFMADMNKASGLKRFYVIDLKKESLLNASLVTHGRCNQAWLEGRKYGNEPGCGCTSTGKYKIGKAYHGQFGLAYKLYGLEKTNNNAFKRFVVLHSHDCVPSSEVVFDICQSDGCPTVSPDFLFQLKPIIEGSKKPVLLWIFE